ncbi:MAG: four helix bundle protein [Taibaiella sp.]|nr:four helix bundle protein [Taibaiella sp.]
MDEALKKKNLIVQLTFEFALMSVKFCALLDEHKKWSLSNQLLRASLSIGANVKEAQNAESKADFIHKMKIAAKEADEVEFYIDVCNSSELLPNCDELAEKITSICKVLNKIISSSKQISPTNQPLVN